MDLKRKITVVQLIRLISGKGLLIGGGLIDESIDCRKYVGGKVNVQNEDGSLFEVDVLDYKEQSSLIEKKNVFFLLPISYEHLIKENALVFV